MTQAHITLFKTCSKCRTPKAISEFYIINLKPRAACKQCYADDGQRLAQRSKPSMPIRLDRKLITRIFSKITVDPLKTYRGVPCWLWTGAIHKKSGYSHLRVARRVVHVHRFLYGLVVKPIPDNLHSDHLCRVRHCVNPVHIEPVTNKENIMRGVSFAVENIAKTHCLQSHPYEGANLVIRIRKGKVVGRDCRQCRKASIKKYWSTKPPDHPARDRQRRQMRESYYRRKARLAQDSRLK